MAECRDQLFRREKKKRALGRFSAKAKSSRRGGKVVSRRRRRYEKALHANLKKRERRKERGAAVWREILKN